MNYKEFLKIDWCNKAQSKHYAGDGIEFSITKLKDRYNFTFRNGANKYFGDFVRIGVYDDMVVMTAGDESDGYKLGRPSKSKKPTYITGVTFKVAENRFEAFIGDYEKISYNKDFDIYFVRKGEKV
ncbi:MAG: hypothetical protein IIY21_20855 [Clostridiales bacterium]|nr:hypothetical protein [Clostridiales bacterium]